MSPRRPTYTVEVVARPGLRQKWHVRVRFPNGELLMASEKYKRRDHALRVANDLSIALGAPAPEVM